MLLFRHTCTNAHCSLSVQVMPHCCTTVIVYLRCCITQSSVLGVCHSWGAASIYFNLITLRHLKEQDLAMCLATSVLCQLTTQVGVLSKWNSIASAAQPWCCSTGLD